jgi:hypothetical protein
MLGSIHYTQIIYRLTVIMNNPREGGKVILALFKFINDFPTKENIQFCIEMMAMNFGYPLNIPQQILINVLLFEID